MTIAFIVIIGVLDENSLMRRAMHKYEIAELKSEIERYTEQFEEAYMPSVPALDSSLGAEHAPARMPMIAKRKNFFIQHFQR